MSLLLKRIQIKQVNSNTLLNLSTYFKQAYQICIIFLCYTIVHHYLAMLYTELHTKDTQV